jgi:Na+/melibiose symporter-like transporter
VTHTALPTRTKLFYGLGSIAFGVKDNGFQFFLLLYYNQVLGLPATWVGFGIMVALVVDALSDPVVGHLSDHLHSRWGRRHPFMYGAALPVAASYWLLWNPPAGLGPEALFVYFVLVACLVRTFITFYEIPSSSLVAELTQHYHERTTVLGYRYFFGWWGGLTMSVLAYLVFLQPDAYHAVGVLNAHGYRRYGVIASLVMLAAILVSALGTHSYIPKLRRPPARRRLGLRGVAREMIETLSNPSLAALFGAGVFAAIGTGLTSALSIYINTYFWEFTSSQISVLVLGLFVSALLAVALAPRLSLRLGKKHATILVAFAALLLGPMPVTLRLFGIFPPNGSPALLPLVAGFAVASVAMLIAASVLVASMIADLAEDSELTTGRRSEGVFVAANTFVQKTVSGIGIFGSGLLLRAVGFPSDATPGNVDPMVVRNLGLAYVPVLVAVYLAAIGFLSRYRISRASHEAAVQRLASRRG